MYFIFQLNEVRTTETPEKIQRNTEVCDLDSNSKKNIVGICNECLQRKKCNISLAYIYIYERDIYIYIYIYIAKLLKWIGGILILILIIIIAILTYLYITVKLKYEELDSDFNDLEDKYADVIHKLKNYKGPWKDTSYFTSNLY